MAAIIPAERRRLQDNYSAVCGRVHSANPAGKPATLVCVTKHARLEWAAELVHAGAQHLGENLLPAAQERFSALNSAGLSFTRHLIGAQQSRKLKLIPGHFDWLQALDRMESAARLSDLCSAANLKLQVLLEVNLASEPQKHGFTVDQAAPAAERFAVTYPALELRGLMAIPPGPSDYATKAEWEMGTRGHFETLRRLFDRIAASGGRPGRWDTLSMGMSADYVWALEAGATMVRVGSALFKGLEG